MAKKLDRHIAISPKEDFQPLVEIAPIVKAAPDKWVKVHPDWMKFNLEDQKFYNSETGKPLKYEFTYEVSLYKNLLDPTGAAGLYPPASFATQETGARVKALLQKLAPNALIQLRQSAIWTGPFLRSVPELNVWVNDNYYGNAGLMAIQLQSIGWYWWCQYHSGALRQNGIRVPNAELLEPEHV